MNKNFFSRVIMVIIVALLGTMFLAPSTAFCADATEVQEALDICSKKIDALNNLGCKIVIYDGEFSDQPFKEFLKNYEPLEERCIIFNFKEIGWFGGWKYDIRVGEGIDADYANLIEYDKSDFSSRDEWMIHIVNEHLDIILDDFYSAIQPQDDAVEANTNEEANTNKGFEEFKSTMAEGLLYVAKLFVSILKNGFEMLFENPAILAAAIVVVIALVVLWMLKKLAFWGAKKLGKFLSNQLKRFGKFLKKCCTRKRKN